jgi:hypothetical protein
VAVTLIVSHEGKIIDKEFSRKQYTGEYLGLKERKRRRIKKIA